MERTWYNTFCGSYSKGRRMPTRSRRRKRGFKETTSSWQRRKFIDHGVG